MRWVRRIRKWELEEHYLVDGHVFSIKLEGRLILIHKRFSIPIYMLHLIGMNSRQLYAYIKCSCTHIQIAIHRNITTPKVCIKALHNISYEITSILNYESASCPYIFQFCIQHQQSKPQLPCDIPKIHKSRYSLGDPPAACTLNPTPDVSI